MPSKRSCKKERGAGLGGGQDGGWRSPEDAWGSDGGGLLLGSRAEGRNVDRCEGCASAVLTGLG